MKQGVSFSYEEKGDYIYRNYCLNGKPDPKRRMPMVFNKNTQIYEHEFLSWENLTYCFTDYDKDEEDDYLLHHALQDNKKTSVYIWTRNVEKVLSSYDTIYKTHVEEGTNNFYRVFVMRNGKLSDYFDEDEIMDYYDEQNVPYREGTLGYLMHAEMIDLINGKTIYDKTPYSPLMDINVFHSDPVVSEYGVAGGLIAGLLFGYPIESSIEFVKKNFPY